MKKHFPLDATSPEPSQLYGKASFPTEAIEAQQQVNDIIAATLDMGIPHSEEPPDVIGNIDMRKLRDLLFSIRDNQIYCPLCRCPEFSPSPETRTSHYEDCSIGLICEEFLRLYPKENFVIKWRK
jgi:hypothetical protein